MKRIIGLFAAAVLGMAAVSCSEESVIVEPVINVNHIIRNGLEVPVTLEGDCLGGHFNIPIGAGEQYTYVQDHMSGAVEKGKYAVLTAKVLTITVDGGKTIRLYGSEESGVEADRHILDHVTSSGKEEMMLVIDQAFVDRF